MARVGARHQVAVPRLGQLVAGQPRILEQCLQVRRHQCVVVAWHRAVVGPLGYFRVVRQPVEPRRIEAEDLALGALGELG